MPAASGVDTQPPANQAPDFNDYPSSIYSPLYSLQVDSSAG